MHVTDSISSHVASLPSWINKGYSQWVILGRMLCIGHDHEPCRNGGKDRDAAREGQTRVGSRNDVIAGVHIGSTLRMWWISLRRRRCGLSLQLLWQFVFYCCLFERQETLGSVKTTSTYPWMFSFWRPPSQFGVILEKQVCVEPRTSALNMTLSAAAARAPADIDRYLALALPPPPGCSLW